MLFVSVVIPCYKRVEQTLKSISLLMSQSGIGSDFDIEIIVVDSGPDTVLKDALQKEFGNKILYTIPQKKGISANKNHGAHVAKGDILIFCDTDIEVEKETLIKTIETLKNTKTAASVCGQVVWRGGEKNRVVDRPRSEDLILSLDGVLYVEAIYSRFMATYKKIFFAVGGYDEIAFGMRGEGSDLSARYWRRGYPLVYNPDIAVHHIYEATDSAAIRKPHPELDIAKDLFLLAYKYNMQKKDYNHFAAVIEHNFGHFGTIGYLRILQGIMLHLDSIVQVKPYLESQKEVQNDLYDFKFLEVFSDSEMLKACIAEAAQRLSSARECF